ncbi:30S ribosome-binding factor RbfA [bacterium]|nr:30S ribosome-binding factor RbfA [bacterium]
MKKEISKRHYQVGESIKRTLSKLFLEGRFEYKIKDLFSILEVVPSRGFETAVVYVSALDPSKNEEVVKKLNEISSEIRYELANNSEFRTTPTLIFKLDTSLDYAKRIDDILNSEEVRKDLEE